MSENETSNTSEPRVLASLIKLAPSAMEMSNVEVPGRLEESPEVSQVAQPAQSTDPELMMQLTLLLAAQEKAAIGRAKEADTKRVKLATELRTLHNAAHQMYTYALTRLSTEVTRLEILTPGPLLAEQLLKQLLEQQSTNRVMLKGDRKQISQDLEFWRERMLGLAAGMESDWTDNVRTHKAQLERAEGAVVRLGTIQQTGLFHMAMLSVGAGVISSFTTLLAVGGLYLVSQT